MNGRTPHFPFELRSRLCVQTKIGDQWSDPRQATMAELIAAVRELSPEEQATIAGALGVIPEHAAARLAAAEDVLEALADARLAIDRLRTYRAKYPEKRHEEHETT